MIDLFSRFDTVSRSQRSLVAECERQQSRLIQLLHWYDHQREARAVELRRQSEHINKETRQQINARSKTVIRERERLKHLLDDNDDRTEIFSLATSKSYFRMQDNIDNRKRKTYGCSLPRFKAPLTKSSDSWLQFKSHSALNLFEDKKRREKQRYSINKFIQSPIEQRNRMNTIINKCLYEFEQCECDGYDHFLRTSEPNRNAQVLAQQIINDQNQNKYR
jgi:hypothetical protein